MIIPATVPLVAYRNGDLTYNAQLTVSGTPLDLTGWVGLIQFRAYPGATGNPYISLTTGYPPTTAGSLFSFTSPTEGRFSLFIARGDWANFPLSNPPYFEALKAFGDMVLTDPSAVVDPYLNLPLTLNAGVSIAP